MNTKFSALLKRLNVQQAEIAGCLDLTAAAISMKINGGRPWKLDEARQILAHLRDNHDPELTLDDLFGDPLAEDVADASEVAHG